ncbi:MAG TPA: radical SAM protein [Clostridia bacterium]|nr:radical SAM protein [Clostridia bacterium]
MSDKIRVSFGTASVLGLSTSRLDAVPTCAYLMVGERCVFPCSFCPQSTRSAGRADPRMLSRVIWPEYETNAVLERLKTACTKGLIRRVCIQSVESPGTRLLVMDLVEKLHDALTVPISVSLSPGSLSDVREIFARGGARVGLPLDVATPGLYARIKGGAFGAAKRAILKASEEFPGRISTHLIIGLGETEEDALRLVQEMVDAGVKTALFAFTPVRGTPLENMKQPPLDMYRMIQVSRALMEAKKLRVSDITFRDGRAIDLGDAALRVIFEDDGFIASALRTSGCPDCNRPFYNERPGGVMYNFPRPLAPREEREERGFLARVIRERAAGCSCETQSNHAAQCDREAQCI